ncbi:MAG: hypothetical protein IH609_03225 [Dehalococcoidia bacterium]|nr:hypothetical protein [Dehalococcoidia bacterium]
MTQQAKFTVSERDREYMRRLGRYVEEANEAARKEWLALPGAERIAKSEAFSRRARGYAHSKTEPDDLGLIYSRARQLGLLRS